MGMENHLLEVVKPDYATPALYFFSTVAQTMGAILAIVLTGVFAIIPQMHQRNNHPGSELLVRLMKKDKEFIQAVYSGFTAIILSIVSLFLLYMHGLSNFLSTLLIFSSALICIVASVLSCTCIWIFITKNISKYSTIHNILDDIMNIRFLDYSKYDEDSIANFIEVGIIYDIYLEMIIYLQRRY